ncbi:MAG: hypothetical protein H0W75_03110 [Chitinophagaceae bacterium]|nr:hypothetical protein [Chitinophagaceae bacterium]
MKNRIILLVILVFMGVISAQAQQQGQRRTAEERSKMIVDKLSDSLKLIPAQKTDIDLVYLEFYKAQDKLREGLAPGTRPEKADIEKIAEARDAKLKIILKEDQYTKLKAMEAAMRQRSQQRPPGQ